MKTIHLIVVGDESVDEHLAGVPILGAHSAILFDVNNMRREKTEELREKLKEMGVPGQRMGTESEDYRDVYWAGRSVFEGYLSQKEALWFAINLSTGSRMALAALEDSLRSRPEDLPHFIPVEQPVLSAFRYELIAGDKWGVKLAPLTFPPVPLVMPGGKWVRYAGFRQKLAASRQGFSLSWLYFKIRTRRKWRRFKRRISKRGRS